MAGNNQGRPKRKRSGRQSLRSGDERDAVTPAKSSRTEDQMLANSAPGILALRSQLHKPNGQPETLTEDDSMLPSAPPTPSPVNQQTRGMITANSAPEMENDRSPSNSSIETPRQRTATETTEDPYESQEEISIKDRVAAAEARVETKTSTRPSTKAPLTKYTKGEMPKVHLQKLTAALNDIDLNLIGRWENLPEGKLLAQPFGAYASNPENHTTIKSLIFGAVIEVTEAKEVSICAPRKSPSSENTPITFMIYNLTEDQKCILLTRQVWSSQSITFRVLPMKPICPDYLFSIRGLTISKPEEIKEAVEAVWFDIETDEFLASIYEKAPEADQERVKASLLKFVNSVKVNTLDTRKPGNIPAPAFRVYADGSAVKKDDTWFQLREYFVNREYQSQFQEIGTNFVPNRACGLCHSIDHPRGLCPFPEIAGWNGPPRRKDPPLAEQERRGFDSPMNRDRSRAD